MLPSVVRRLTSYMLALCLTVFSLEAGVADTHASRAVEAETAASLSLSAQPLTPSSANLPHGELPHQPGSLRHLCHCTHTHVATSTPPQSATTLFPPPHRNAPAPGERPIVSREQEPPSRPPIA